MRYTVTGDFIKINETAGTIQNTSQIYALEVSAYQSADSGVLVYALNSITFRGSPVYMRCVDPNGFVDARVVTFTLGGSAEIPVEPDDPNVAIIDGVRYTVANDDEINAALDDIFNGDGGQTSSGDSEFDSSLDDIFG